MKVTIVSNFDLASGRGPVYRLMNILPYIAENIDLQIISLQEPDLTSLNIFEKYNIKYQVINYDADGWFVKDSKSVTRTIKKYIIDTKSDLCILGWEFWDMAIALNEALWDTECEFAIVFHSIPFVDAVPFPSNYQVDIDNRVLCETNQMIKSYIIERSKNAEENIRRFKIISINETISYYLDTYFHGLNYYKAYPGYALDLNNITELVVPKKEYDFIFMSKLETSKGIFELIEIASKLKKINSSYRIRIIGDFLYDEEKERVLSLIYEHGIEKMISFAGWLSDSEKYKEIKKGKVFLYPSLTGDTFSFCLLEALACGLQVVCYDTPFARIIYKDAPVVRIGYKDTESFALTAKKIIDDINETISNQAIDFVKKNYSDWKNVALAEESVYEQICKDTK